MVSLSTSKDSKTATRPPLGHFAGLRLLPARTAFTTVRTLSIDHFHPGLAAGGAAAVLRGEGAAPEQPIETRPAAIGNMGYRAIRPASFQRAEQRGRLLLRTRQTVEAALPGQAPPEPLVP